ncbi:MAG: DNA mismatch repair protein [Myxococcales bacterium]|nr:DNA mismatch repair protein [Myxococcales bacterium]
MLPPTVDLLDAIPHRRVDVEAVDHALLFAFAGSGAGGLFVDALDAAPAPTSTWSPEGYAEDLFLAPLLRSCFRLPAIGGHKTPLALTHLLRVVASPPKDPDSVVFRRAILAELVASEPLRAALTSTYDALNRFRQRIEGNAVADRIDPSRRQLDVLGCFRDLIETMAEGFATATSGLSRLRDYAERVRGLEAYRALVDLLSYDDRMATVSFRVRIGADGRVRDLELIAVEEDGKNPFVSSPMRRWQAKLELLFRGYRFGDGEVMARLLDAVYEGIRPELPALVQLFGDLELYLGALGFPDRALEAGLEVCLPELAGDGPRRLIRLFNPLLLASGIEPVPCDVDSDRHDTSVLITGPNSGGKTRLLQSLGLSQLLAQGGLFVPAAEARLVASSGLLVSLIQHTSVDQTEGRLGVELMRIRSLFERLPIGAMVILDELCSGTNPSEGEEIFELVLRMLDRLEPQAFITTHFLRFAARLERDAPVESLRFLQVVLGPNQVPTYQFAPGVATTSLAAQAAARLGVTGDQLLALIDERRQAFALAGE